MPEGNLACEGIVDVGLVIIAHWTNPAQKEASDFLVRVLQQNIHAVIPVSAFLGAYLVMTRRIHLPPVETALALAKTLAAPTDAFYEPIHREDAQSALVFASGLRIESWDGFLLALARRLGTHTIFSIDRELHQRAPDFTVVCPLKEETLKAYHQFLNERQK